MKIYSYLEQYNICGVRVKQARKQRKMTQEQLAAQMQIKGVQVNQRAISRIETGDRLVTDYELLCFAKVLNVELNWLLIHDP